MNNYENTSLYSCWQNLVLFILKKKKDAMDQENGENKNDHILALGAKATPEIIDTATKEAMNTLCHTDTFKNENIEICHLKSGEEEGLDRNSISKNDKLKVLRNAPYLDKKVDNTRKINSDVFNKGDFRKHFKYPKVYALHKTESGLQIGLNKQCKKSYMPHDSLRKYSCSHCGTMNVTTDSLKHPLEFDYAMVKNSKNSSNNVQAEKTNDGHIKKVDLHVSLVHLIRKVKAMEKRIAQLERDAEFRKAKNEEITIKTMDDIHSNVLQTDRFLHKNDTQNLSKRFPIAIHKLRSQKYREKKELESVNVQSETMSFAPKEMSEKSMDNGTVNTINKSKRKFRCNHNFDQIESERRTHSVVLNDVMNKNSEANTINIKITNKKVCDPDEIKTIFLKKENSNPIEGDKSTLENISDKHSKYDLKDEESKFDKNSIDGISDSKSCWSSFKTMFSHSSKANDRSKIPKIIRSNPRLPETKKSEKHISDDLTSITNSERDSIRNPSDQNTVYQTYNVNTNHRDLENTKCLDMRVDANSSHLQSKSPDKTHSYTNINYKELLKTTVKHPSKLGNMVTLPFEEKSHLLREQCQHLDDINNKIQMVHYHYEKHK